MMNPPTDMGRDQLAREIHHADVNSDIGWSGLHPTARQHYLEMADTLLARSVVLARTHHGEATALDYTQGAIAQAMDQATTHAADALRSARELGTAVYYDSSVTADEQALVQMIGQAYVTGHRAAASAACGALDDIARLQAEVDEANTMLSTVRALVAEAKACAAEHRAVMVELPEKAPTPPDVDPFDGSYPTVSQGLRAAAGRYRADEIAIYDLNTGDAVTNMSADDARALVPQLLALLRDHDRAAADARHSQVLDFAHRIHSTRCDDGQDVAANCPRCMDIAADAVAHFAPDAA